MKATPGKTFFTDHRLLLIMEYGVYLFALLMFAGKFGTFREIGLYLPALLWIFRSAQRKEIDLQWREPVFLALAALLLSAVLSSLFASSLWQSVHVLKKEYLKVLILYIVISTTFASPESLKRFALFLALTGVVYLVAGYSRIVLDLVKTGAIRYEETRYYATIFLYFLSFLFLQTLNGSRGKRAVWTVVLLATLAGLLITGVRGSWLGVLGIGLMWSVFLRGKTGSLPVVFKAGLPAVAALIVAVFVLFPGQYRLIREHTLQKLQVSMRAETWNTFLLMSKERSFMAQGLDDTEMTERYREFFKGIKGKYPEDGINPTTPHNQFIKILYQQGVIGLLIYGVLLGTLFWRVTRKFFQDRESGYAFVGIAAIAGVLGEYVIRCLTEDRSLVPFGLLLGIAGAYLSIKDGRDFVVKK